MDLREKIARAAALAIRKQDDYGGEGGGDGLGADLTIAYIDQGATGFGEVADAILAIPEIAEALANMPDKLTSTVIEGDTLHLRRD